ncbi:microfibrillar-associated protein 1 isoform X1 [Hydra vulgaris]|uniref:Microfibrillar-associated protein 1 n=1 Tax=Hydra vulgaris TaxID=6087 RepID=T2MF25_HYDVU|nr:microfibrillar-associated protein 1 [Hydra vulgaris]
MEHVRFGSDFKNQPRIGHRYIQSTAGAVTTKTAKGSLIVEKVNVKRYIAGKKPEWAADESSEDESDDEGLQDNEQGQHSPQQLHADDIEEDIEEIRDDHGRRRVYEPRIVTQHDEEEEERKHSKRSEESSDEENNAEEELDEAAIERRREILKKRAQIRKEKEKDLLDVEEDEDLIEEEEEEESSEYEEYSDSDEENTLRLKPVFVRKNDRITIQERERIQTETEISEEKMKKILEERKRASTRLVNEIIQEELKEEQGVVEIEQLVITDDENDEEEYEAWKVRELKRIKRDKDEKEAREREKLEIERMHNLTEEERREELRRKPKIITNKGTKGKYKFLQKYYHRGAFFMDKEEDIFKRDFTGATLEDHFDKTVLPKAMQVKNFGRSGRTKYTHLVDQDTAQADSPWFSETAQGLKYHEKISGGLKQQFEKPSRKKR